MKLTYTPAELADVLGVSEQTVLNTRSSHPCEVPPALDLHWSRRPVWLIEDVHEWLRARSPMQQTKPTRGRRATPHHAQEKEWKTSTD